MKTFQKLTLLLLVLVIVACSKEDKEENEINPMATTFEQVIATGDDFESFPESRTEEVTSTSDPENEDYTSTENGVTEVVRYVCTTKTLDVLDGNGSFPLFNTSADVIYPGNLLQGATLSNVTPSPIVVERAGGTVSYNLNNGNTSSSFSVEEVKKSTIQDAMNNIIANAGSIVPANFQLDIVQIESESQLALELGISAQTFNAQVSADLSFSSEQSFNRTLVKLNQSYYTMSFDLPTSLEEIFSPSVTPEQLGNYVQEDNPAAFISSVTYGRIFYMLIESTSSREEMDSKINLAYGAFQNSVEAELEVNALEELASLKIKVIAYGGDAEGAFQIAGETNVSDIANKLSENTDIRAGLPLSYVVRSVERPDQIVGTRLSTQYEVVECELKGSLPPAGLGSIVDLFGDDEDGGGIGAMANVSDSNVLLFNKKGDKYAWYNGNSGEIKAVFNIDDPNSPLGIVPLDAIGAAIQQGDKDIYFFDQSGLSASILDYNMSSWSGNGDAPTSPMGNWEIDSEDDDNIFLVNPLYGDTPNFQFGNYGFGAACRTGNVHFSFFRKQGDQYAFYAIQSGDSNFTWKNPLNSNTWFDNEIAQDGNVLFDNVGAATSLQFNGSSGRTYLINEAGDQMMEFLTATNGERILNGPWVIN